MTGSSFEGSTTDSISRVAKQSLEVLQFLMQFTHTLEVQPGSRVFPAVCEDCQSIPQLLPCFLVSHQLCWPL